MQGAGRPETAGWASARLSAYSARSMRCSSCPTAASMHGPGTPRSRAYSRSTSRPVSAPGSALNCARQNWQTPSCQLLH
jgi:hypothetical protein